MPFPQSTVLVLRNFPSLPSGEEKSVLPALFRHVAGIFPSQASATSLFQDRDDDVFFRCIRELSQLTFLKNPAFL